MNGKRCGQSLLAVLVVAFVVSILVATVVSGLHVWQARNDMYQDDLQERAGRMELSVVGED